MKLFAFVQFGVWYLRNDLGETIAVLGRCGEREAKELARRWNCHENLVEAVRQEMAETATKKVG